MRTPSESRDVRYELARSRARGLLTLTRQRPPVDLDAIIERAGVPVGERILIDGIRGTIGDVAGRRTIILNRRHRFSTEQERKWVLAEEVGHVLLGHRLVESTQPGKSTMGLLEERRIIYEREAAHLRGNYWCLSSRCGGDSLRSRKNALLRGN